jgi:hypothetical protein
MPRFDTPSRLGAPAARQQPLRIGLRALLIAAFAGALLVALSGAFLIGLAVIGVLAAAIASGELVHRQLSRPAKPTTGAFDHPVGL